MYILSLLLVGGSAFAETMITRDCETKRKRRGYPYYYCYCKEESETFQFPQDRIVSDTMWFDASVDDLKQGLTAYWFADCAVTMEVYAFCVSKTPTISFTVGSNQMREKSVDEINKKLDEMGGLAELMGSVLTPHIRVYPHKKDSGHVYCYPYNQGPHSTCDSLLPVRTSMTYISSHADDVYELEPKTMPSSGKLFVHWKEKNNQPCTMEIARTCDGAAVATASLSDSLRVCFVDSALLRQSKQANQSLFFRFTHQAEHVGRIHFTPNPVIIDSLRDTTLCMGLYPPHNDTLWLVADTLVRNLHNVSFTLPDTLTDTLRILETALAEGYYYAPAHTTIRDSGHHVFTLTTPMECTQVIDLYVIANTPNTPTTLHTTHYQETPALFFDPKYGIYIRKEGKRYTLLGTPLPTE